MGSSGSGAFNFGNAATGGDGGGVNLPLGVGQAGAGGSATCESVGQTLGTGVTYLTVWATSIGGAGGVATRNGSGGAGGNASATAFAQIVSPAQNLPTIKATATGGAGGQGSGVGNTGGNGGTASATAAATSSGGANLSVTVTEVGGAGGNSINGALGGSGASVANGTTNLVSGSTSGSLILTLNLTGGAAGGTSDSPGLPFEGSTSTSGDSTGGTLGGTLGSMLPAKSMMLAAPGSPAGLAGSAQAYLNATNPGGGSLSANSSAIGGAGGSLNDTPTTSPVIAGRGGDASNTVISSGSEITAVNGHAGGGAGGFAYLDSNPSTARIGSGGDGGNATSSTLAQSTGGGISASDGASGGAGGNAGVNLLGAAGNGGKGGDASSIIVATGIGLDPLGMPNFVTATAVGGNGGLGVGAGYSGGRGGNAVASATGTSSAGESVLATAVGGIGGDGVVTTGDLTGISAATGTIGLATATAKATGTALQTIASAGATAQGVLGSSASSLVIQQGSGIVKDLQAVSSAFAPYARTSATVRSIGTTFAGIGGLGKNTDYATNETNSLLFPTSAQLSTSQAFNPNNSATFEALGTAPAFVIAQLSDYGQTFGQATSSKLTLELAQPTTGLKIGLLNPIADSLAVPIDNLEFSITLDGAVALDVDFSTLADANAYFADRVLSFAGPATDIAIDLEMTSQSSIPGYGVQVEIGSTAVPFQSQSSAIAGSALDQSQLIATPEPGTVTFSLLGLAAIASRRRRRK